MFKFFNAKKNRNQKKSLRVENLEDRMLLTVAPGVEGIAALTAAESLDYYLADFTEGEIADAISRAEADGHTASEVTLKFDASVGDTFTLTQTFNLNYGTTIDFEGRTVDANGQKMFKFNGGANGLVIKNATLTGALTVADPDTGNAESGAGISVTDGKTITFEHCVICDNCAQDSYGGFAYVSGGTLNMFGCTVYNNSSKAGGVIFACSGSNRGIVNLESSVFYGNHTSGFGGVVEAQYCQLNVYNCTMSANYAADQGGAILIFNYTVKDSQTIYSGSNIYNSIIAYNVAAKGDDVSVYNADSSLAFMENFKVGNSIISQKGDYFANAPTHTCNYNERGDLVSVTFSEDFDLTLKSIAIAIDEGDNAYTPEYAFDAAGNARVYGDTVDIGAFEFQGAGEGTFSTVVTTLSDNSADGTTLRDAILNANRKGNTGEVTFADGLTGTITLTQGELALTNGSCSIINDGLGDIIIDANEKSRVIYIDGLLSGNSGADVTLTGLTVQNGDVSGGNYGTYGAGIWAAYGINLTIDDCVITNNTAHGHGTYGIHGGGLAVTYASHLVMTGSEVSNNSAELDYLNMDESYYTDPESGTVYVTVLYQNERAVGGGIYIGDGTAHNYTYIVCNQSSCTADIRDSSIIGNQAAAANEFESYGNRAAGGGIFNGGAWIKLYNDDISNNMCVGGEVGTEWSNKNDPKYTLGAGIYTQGRKTGTEIINTDIQFCTITGNVLQEYSAGRENIAYECGAAIYNFGSYAVIANSLIADNVATSALQYGVIKGAAIYNDYAMAIYDTTFTANIINNHDIDNSTATAGRTAYGGGICNDRAGSPGAYSSMGCPTLTGCILMNNYIVTNYTSSEAETIIDDAYQNGSSFTMDYCLYRSSGLSVGEEADDFTTTNCKTWRSSYKLFTDAANKDYTLVSNSIAVDRITDPTGSYAPWGEFDLRGTPYVRVYNNAKDLGCYEYQVVSENRLDAPVLTAAAQGTSAITVTWDAVDNAVSYSLEYSTGTTWTAVSVTDTTWTLGDLAEGTTVYFRAKAIADGVTYIDSFYSETVSATTEVIKKLDAPVIQGQATSDSSILVFWTAVEDAGSYTIYYSTDQTQWNNVSVASTTCQLTGLAASTTYYIKAQSIPAGEGRAISDFSNLIDVTTQGGTQKLDTPTGLAYSTYGANRAQLTWTAVDNAESYTVSYSADGTTWQTVTTTDTSAIVTGLTYASVYAYKVKASAAGYQDSDDSEAVSKVCCPSDINSDGKINLKDYTIFSGAYMKQTGFDVRANINGKSIVNVADWGFMSANYGKTATDPTIVNPAALASAVDTLDLDFVEEIAEDYDIDIDLDVF